MICNNLKDTVSIVGTVGTVGTLCIAYIALSTWKKQLKGTDEYKLSKKILQQVYQVQDAITNVRNPMIYLSKDEVESGNRLKEEIKIYDIRLKTLYKEYQKLRVSIMDAKAVWGSEAENKIENISIFINEIKSAIWMHFWLKGAYSPICQVDNSPSRIMENDKIIYDLSDKDNKDDFAKKLADVVYEIEKYFQFKMKNA